MQASRLYLLYFSLILSACDTNNSSLQNLTAQVNPKTEENPIISSEPSENVSLEDYKDEANSILSESYQLVTRAKQANCKEAHQKAQLAIKLSKQAQNSSDKSEAEEIIGKANQALIHSEDALALCEENLSPENPK